MNDDKEKQNPLADVPWIIPAVRVRLADGSTLIKPGKAIQRAQAYVVAKMFDVSTRTLSLLAEAGHIRSARFSPSITFYYPGEIEEFIRSMEANPDYWTEKRRREYGMVRAGRKKGKP